MIESEYIDFIKAMCNILPSIKLLKEFLSLVYIFQIQKYFLGFWIKSYLHLRGPIKKILGKYEAHPNPISSFQKLRTKIVNLDFCIDST